MRSKIIKVLGFIIITIISFVVIGFIKIYAEESIDLSINSKYLYDETNTYQYKYDETIGTDFNNDARYVLDISQKKNERISPSSSITVFTHGWTGWGDSWGNDDKSLVSILQKKWNANIYVLDFKKGGNDSPYLFRVYNSTLNHHYADRLENKIEITDSFYSYTAIFDWTKKNIFVFNGYRTGVENDYIYTQFNYALSRVVYDYKMAKGMLPQINLIGHSRGGLTNMQYALDHPDLINSMYSFDTPYLGTSTGELDFTLYESRIAKSIGGDDAALGEYDLVNPSVYLKYYNRWNSGYDKFYSHIKLMALGAVTSDTYLLSFLEYKFYEIIDGIGCMESLRNLYIKQYGEIEGKMRYDAIRNSICGTALCVIAKIL